jgi:spoIIIJ-associated protein
VTETDVAGSTGSTTGAGHGAADEMSRGAAEASGTGDVAVGEVGVGGEVTPDGLPAAEADTAGSRLAPHDDSVDPRDADQDDADEDDADEDDADEDDDSEDAAPGSGRRGRRSGNASLRRLEEEGEVAADYLEELLDITDLDGDIDIDVENGRASVAVVAESGEDRQLRRLVGAQGEVLEALQELSRLAVQARTGERSRLMLDIAGFRAARRRALEDVGARACQEVQRTGQAMRLDPMSAFERKVVHDVVAGAGLRSESEGEEPGRRVVVFPTSS